MPWPHLSQQDAYFIHMQVWELHSLTYQREEVSHLQELTEGKLVFWMMIVAVHVRHAEASAGSQCEFRVLEKGKLRKLPFSLQTASWQEGRNNHDCECMKTFCFFIFNSSAKSLTPFVLELLWKFTLHSSEKGEVELSSNPPHNILFWTQPAPVFLCYLFGFSVAHTRTHTHTLRMIVWADGVQCVD